VAIKKHVFISFNGEMLPRWKEAFAKAIVATNAQSPAVTHADFIWLRLRTDTPLNKQIEAVRAANPHAALIALSDIPDDDEAMIVFSSAGRGYANTHAAADTLKQIVKVIDQGGLWIGASLMQRLLAGVNQLQKAPSAKPEPVWQSKLTDREMEVARSIAAGASNKEVARQLNITERTVKAHVSGLFTKLAVSDRLQLALKMREIAK